MKLNEICEYVAEAKKPVSRSHLIVQFSDCDCSALVSRLINKYKVLKIVGEDFNGSQLVTCTRDDYVAFINRERSNAVIKKQRAKMKRINLDGAKVNITKEWQFLSNPLAANSVFDFARVVNL